MARLFNAYVMVDWSASQKPKTGKDSIWIGVLKRDVRMQPTYEAHNPPTRAAAAVLLREVLADLRRRSDRALVGFDFSLGYPRGTAAALKLKMDETTSPQAAMWRFLASNVVDKADNTNNRGAVASKANRLMTDGPRPFWGTPSARDAQTWLTATRPAEPYGDLPELRFAEEATRGRGKTGAKTVWQLTGVGSVGSQVIVGVPVVKKLADELGDRALVWPFQTGWRALTPVDVAAHEVVIAEIYPALVEAKARPGEIADEAQVRAMCEHFADLDKAGKLGAAFAAPKDAAPETVGAVEREEGWILGA